MKLLRSLLTLLQLKNGLKHKFPFALHLISPQSKRHNWHITEISFMIFYGKVHICNSTDSDGRNSFLFLSCFSFVSFIQSSHMNQVIRCQVTWTSMNNFISSFFPSHSSMHQSFPHFFTLLRNCKSCLCKNSNALATDDQYILRMFCFQKTHFTFASAQVFFK